MRFLSGVGDIKKVKAASLVKFCYEKGYDKDSYLKELNKILGGMVKKLYDAGEFEGKLNQTLVLHTSPRLALDRVVLVGIGEKEKVNRDSYRQAAGTVSRLTAVRKSKSLVFFLGAGEDENTVQAVVEGFLLGRFDMKDYKTAVKGKDEITSTVYFYGTGKSQIARFDRGTARGQIIADGVILARRLAAHPGNVITPKTFAAEAKSLAGKYRLRSLILDERRIKNERMGALMAVAKGSEQPPRFVILQYHGARVASKPIVLIGKGITFDSGGISIKPSADMDEMKGDMSGGAIALATIVTAARLKLPVNLVSLIPLAENMPSGRALKPGDIVKSRKGKTIEIISTDAEGRLILADALDYADKFKPQAVIDIATLTGAALYVLGYSGAPILGNNENLMNALRDASDTSAERVWEMPIWDDFRELVKSSIADLKNSGGRPAGTMTAAAFLENFIGDWPWAHIDIAYVDLEKSGKPYIPKGATGIGVRLLTELLSHWKKP